MTTNTVKWSDIEAECEHFRSGFVKTFRKYEGQATDERDKSNRAVKVTMASFAAHVGVAQQTFHDWCKQEVVPVSGTTSTSLTIADLNEGLTRVSAGVSILIDHIEELGQDAVKADSTAMSMILTITHLVRDHFAPFVSAEAVDQAAAAWAAAQ